jgi:hypothetical protein
MWFQIYRLHKFGNYKINQAFPFCLELQMNYALLTWYEQEYLKYKAHSEAMPRVPCSMRSFA